jgi:hypothetical protein
MKSELIEEANEDELISVLKAVSYFRHIPVFKVLYTSFFKCKNLTLEQYKELYFFLKEYKDNHPDDYFVKGFSKAISKSNTISKNSKIIFSTMLYNQLYDDDLFKRRTKLEKAISMFYNYNKNIDMAVIRKSKVFKLNNSNIVKAIMRLY